MGKAIGFDTETYLAQQTRAIVERCERLGNKLYLEFGGKIAFDFHAARVLPGYDPNVKIRLLRELSDRAEILICIFAGDIARKKVRADFGIPYDVDTLKLIDDLRDWGLRVSGVVITRFADQPAARVFRARLERRGVRVFTHRATRGYPTEVDLIVSDDGYGANEFIPTDRPIVVVTGPGPGSGKLGTCLSQLFHEHRHGVHAGYAKFETFPIWNLPLKHPVNVAYEAATVELKDVNLIDPFHLAAYGEQAVNYNRDVEAYPLLQRILERITDTAAMYRSPTDMGVNRAGFAIVDDRATQEAARQEVIRRHFRYACEYAVGLVEREDAERAELIMESLGLRAEDRPVVLPARAAAAEAESTGKGNEGSFCGAAIELGDGSIVAGKNSALMHAASAVVLNAIKQISRIPDEIHLLAPTIMESITSLKKDILNMKSVSLDLEETLIALGMSATSNPAAKVAMHRLKDLSGCEFHTTHIPTPGDEAGLRRLGVNVTSDPNFASRSLFIS
ncbi:MAG: DUF1846 domain-containing protein [Thermoanaerobaculaceae bacterium]|jgi:uncharacterized protein (UPF0371 family)|nr:DUF1846 domain-containing protein [Thermoanaerobaculaceae bacterium]